jgi:hypothetical protein
MSMQQAAQATCPKCKFFDDHTSGKAADAGLCRFNPPVSQPSPDQHGLWPVVMAGDWCGHFSADSMTAGTAD